MNPTSVDDIEAGLEEMREIFKLKCLNCKDWYSEDRKCHWVQLSTGKIIWWHVNHYKKKKK